MFYLIENLTVSKKCINDEAHISSRNCGKPRHEHATGAGEHGEGAGAGGPPDCGCDPADPVQEGDAGAAPGDRSGERGAAVTADDGTARQLQDREGECDAEDPPADRESLDVYRPQDEVVAPAAADDGPAGLEGDGREPFHVQATQVSRL